MTADPAETDSSWTDDLRARLDDLLDDYREHLLGALDCLTEDEVRRRLVPSRTTLLGLVKHVTYVEGVWFDQAISGRSYGEIGIATTPDRSFVLRRDDTIATVTSAYRARAQRSRETTAALALGATVSGRGERAVWALHFQVLRELAQHAGHADILREQLLAARTSAATRPD